MIYVLNRHNAAFEVMTDFDTTALEDAQIFTNFSDLSNAFEKDNASSFSFFEILLVVNEESDGTLSITDVGDNTFDTTKTLIDFLNDTALPDEIQS